VVPKTQIREKKNSNPSTTTTKKRNKKECPLWAGMVVHVCRPSTSRWKQDNDQFKASHGKGSQTLSQKQQKRVGVWLKWKRAALSCMKFWIQSLSTAKIKKGCGL
jgi:hypothetical protein